MVSGVSSISEIGILLGRGALISALLVILVLPTLLVAFDRVIMKTTLGADALPFHRQKHSKH